MKKEPYLSGEENENEKKQDMSSSVSKHPPQSAAAKPSNSTKNSAKGEGTNSTDSALTKLSNRLNFLKEWRVHTTNELQSMGKSQGGSYQHSQNQDKYKELNYSQHREKWVGTEVQVSQNSDRVKKLESQSLNHPERVKRSDGQHSHTLDRGKSESHVSINIEKGQVVDGVQSSFSQRTATR